MSDPSVPDAKRQTWRDITHTEWSSRGCEEKLASVSDPSVQDAKRQTWSDITHLGGFLQSRTKGVKGISEQP